MKKMYIVFGAFVIILGILAAVGPQTVFKPCNPAKMMAASSGGCGSGGSCGGSCGGDVHAKESDCCSADGHTHEQDAPAVIGACGGPCGLGCGCGNSGTCKGEGCATLGGICGEPLDADGAPETAAASGGCGGGCGSGSGSGGGCGTASFDDYPVCFWTVQAVMGLGFLIIALGLCIIVFSDPRINLGLSIGTFLSGIVTLFVPNSLIPGCSVADMACRTSTFPAITVISIILIALSIAYIVYLEIKNKVFA